MLRHVHLKMRQGMMHQGVEDFLSGQSILCTTGQTPSSTARVDVCVTDDKTSLLKSVSEPVPIILCADFANRSEVMSAVQKGIQGCVSVWGSYQQLLNAIDCVCQGQKFLCPLLSELVCTSLEQPVNGQLTPRESEVINWISFGYSSKQIGRKLGLSHYTVETHRRNIMLKIGARNVAELTRYAFSRELAEKNSLKNEALHD